MSAPRLGRVDTGAADRPLVALGLMSGTSCDGIDAIALALDSVRVPHEPRVLGHVHRPFARPLRTRLLGAAELAVPDLAELHFRLADEYAAAVRELVRATGGGAARARVVGMHGQTVWHQPNAGRGRVRGTLQIGSSGTLAQRIGIPVVADFRTADMALGGQGAPIVPVAHWLFTPPPRTPRLVVNFGGIANFTWVARRLDDVFAYDIGPGMMLIDAFAERASEGRLTFDRDGALSRPGVVIEELLRKILAHPFLRRRPPKSTGREEFGSAFAEPLFRAYVRHRTCDVARTLVAATAAFSAETFARDRRVREARECLVSGGGARHPVLMEELAARLAPVPVRAEPSGALAPEHHEPAAMAVIAARTLRGLPSSLPSVTGAARPALLGHIYYPTTAPAAKVSARRRSGARGGATTRRPAV